PDRTLAAITPVVMTGEPAPANPSPPNGGAPTWGGESIINGISGYFGPELAVNSRGDVAFQAGVLFGGCSLQSCQTRTGWFFKPSGGAVQVIGWEAYQPAGTLNEITRLTMN